MNHVSKSYGKKRIVEDICLSIERPEILGLLGPSGAGKTTLVKMIAGIEEVTDGEICLLGERMPRLKLMEQIGYMAQSDALYGELTAKENIYFFAKLYGLRGKTMKGQCEKALELVGLLDDQNKIIDTFSGGMKRRLSLAIALVHHPRILILDEPTVGIDPVLRNQIWEQLHELKNEGITIIVTTHVMDEAERCDRLGMIRNGRLLALDTPEGLKQDTRSQTIEEAFLFYGGGAHAQ
ncbi:ABC transporter ATP-binding protein [Pullulanibacillus pueri]|nr:ABC transporter ATP-binding protein [Pullulanibacillus pueri]